MPQLPPPLPTNRAFVVQLRDQPPGALLSWDGRVEHVVWGGSRRTLPLAGRVAGVHTPRRQGVQAE